MSPSDTTTSLEGAVAKVASVIQIDDIRLRFMTAVIGAPSPGELPARWVDEVSTTHEGHAVLGEVDADAPVADDLSHFLATVSFQIEYWAPDRTPAEDEVPDVGLFAAFDLTYDLTSSEGLRYAELQEFARVNAVFNAWPYWRELVHSTTRRMGFTVPLVVGVLTASALVNAD